MVGSMNSYISRNNSIDEEVVRWKKWLQQKDQWCWSARWWKNKYHIHMLTTTGRIEWGPREVKSCRRIYWMEGKQTNIYTSNIHVDNSYQFPRQDHCEVQRQPKIWPYNLGRKTSETLTATPFGKHKVVITQYLHRKYNELDIVASSWAMMYESTENIIDGVYTPTCKNSLHQHFLRFLNKAIMYVIRSLRYRAST